MKDPRPLLDGELPDEIATILRAANEDVHPNPGAQGARLLARFGKQPTSATAAPTASVRRFGSLRNVIVYTGLAAAAGLFAFGWRASTNEASAPIARAPIVAPSEATPEATSEAPSAPIVAAPVTALPSMPSMDVSALPTSPPEPKPAAVNAKAGAAAKPNRAGPSLDEELARIDHARALVGSGKPSEALAEVKAYRREYAKPSFADEADSLEVRALAAMGRKDEARALADRFLTRRPGSPYAEAVRAAAGVHQ